MHAERLNSPTTEFPAFCEAVRTWLRDAACADPSLAAVADLVEWTCDPIDVDELTRLVVDAADMHRALGASALLSLWSGLLA